MEQKMEESEVGGEYLKAEGEKSLCPYCKAPLQSGQTQYLSNYWQWNSKTKRYEREEPDSNADEPFCTTCRAEYWESLYR
jgi:uncharacterized protein with PIN domain